MKRNFIVEIFFIFLLSDVLQSLKKVKIQNIAHVVLIERSGSLLKSKKDYRNYSSFNEITSVINARQEIQS